MPYVKRIMSFLPVGARATIARHPSSMQQEELRNMTAHLKHLLESNFIFLMAGPTVIGQTNQ